MHYGASLDVRFDDDPTSFVEYLASLGLTHVEFRQSYLDTWTERWDVTTLQELRERYDVTYTLHAPYSDCNPGALNESLRSTITDLLVDTLDTAEVIGAGAIVVHGGAVRRSYPAKAKNRAREQAVRTIRQAARHAEEIGVPLCVENQRQKQTKRYHTSTPSRLAAFLDDVGVDSEYLGVTLDVGHARASGIDPQEFVERFEDRIVVAHLHDNDGTADDHDPLPEYESIARDIGAQYNVLEMKSKADIERCVTHNVTRDDDSL